MICKCNLNEMGIEIGSSCILFVVSFNTRVCVCVCEGEREREIAAW